jgi:hypothetical protein
MSRLKPISNPLFGHFIAVNGATTADEVKSVISEFGLRLAIGTHSPVLGFLVSFSTLNGVSRFKDSRYPKFKDLPILLEAANGKACTVISYETDFSKFHEDIKSIFTHQEIYENGLCRAMKLNITWPLPEELRKIKEEFGELKIMVKTSMEMRGRQLDVKEAIGRTLEYEKSADYIIIDRPVSHNNAVDHSLELYAELRRQGCFSPVGFSGEIDSRSAADLMKNLRNGSERNISITAQDRVRDNTTGYLSESTLNLEKVGCFIESTSKAFSQKEP